MEISRKLLALLLIAAPASASAPGAPRERAPSPWLWLLPGGGQFALGQNARGAAYAAGTLSLAGWGGYAATRRVSGELNAPLVYAQQVYVLSLYEGYRDLRARAGAGGGPAPIDPASLGELAAEPFRWERLKSPWVLGSAALGAGLNFAATRTRAGRRGFGAARRVDYLGDSFNRDLGAAVYSAYWIPISLGAGVSEEALFRGVFQSEWERRWGPGRGLAAASALFGVAHLSRPGDPESWLDVAFAGAAGAFLGWRYQRNGHRLGESIAAHTWFDIAAGLALFFSDPSSNPLGARVGYAF